MSGSGSMCSVSLEWMVFTFWGALIVSCGKISINAMLRKLIHIKRRAERKSSRHSVRSHIDRHNFKTHLDEEALLR